MGSLSLLGMPVTILDDIEGDNMLFVQGGKVVAAWIDGELINPDVQVEEVGPGCMTPTPELLDRAAAAIIGSPDDETPEPEDKPPRITSDMRTRIKTRYEELKVDGRAPRGTIPMIAGEFDVDRQQVHNIVYAQDGH